MSKLTPLILAVIMLASTSLVALDWAELEQKNMIEADGRSGPDAEVVSIMSPRATTTDTITGDQLHTLKAGEDVNFETYISNVGDTAIDEMGITVTVYLSEGGARGMIAKDAAGNDLSWTNGDVVCDDSFVCPWVSLDAGAALDYGKYTMSYQGAVVSWTPITGDYVVVVTTSAVGDNDPGNDYSENFVSVVDWTDIIVDLTWDSGKEVEGGSGDKAFTLTVGTGGSSSWVARSVVIEMVVEGTLIAGETVDSNGNSIMGTTFIGEDNTTLGGGFGTWVQNAETYRNGEDDNNTTSGERHEISFMANSTWNGVVSPDSSGASGEYSVEVQLKSYVMYGQLPDCARTVEEGTGDDRTQREVVDFCEVESFNDDVASTSEDKIEGFTNNFHDIGISNLVINQGYITNVDENGILQVSSGPTMPGVTSGPLNPAMSNVQATVRHMGSDSMTTYDWKVTFDIENTVSGETHTEDADSCEHGIGEVYIHKELGNNMDNPEAAFEVGEACIMFEFTPGIYNVTATISMVNAPANTFDMSGRNDDSTIYEIAALNNRPVVSLTVEQDPNSIVIGGEGFITIMADADDADDDAGLFLNYVWTHPAMVVIDGAPVPSQCNGMGPEFSTCNLVAFDSEWAGVQTYSVMVSDEHGSSAQDFTNIFVWNKIVAEDSTDNGIYMEYDLTYNGINAFEVTVDDSSEGPYTQDLTSFGYAGDYTSVAVVDYIPSTTYLPEDVNSQAITLNFNPDNLEPTSVFWISNGNWAELDSTISQSAGSIIIDMGVGNQVLPQGEIVLMGGEIILVEPPTASVTALTIVDENVNGAVIASWQYSGITGANDWLSMTICDSANNCATTLENTSKVDHSLSGQTGATHGETYTFTLQVCNVGGCNPTIATGSGTSDSQVDGDAVATELKVANKANSTAWTVSWTPGGDTSDVVSWKVCYSREDWDSPGEMPSTCSALSDSTTVDVDNAGKQAGTWYFTAVPCDSMNVATNCKTALSLNDITLTKSVDECTEDCDKEDVGDETKSGAFPTEAYVAIGALIVIAFVAGAFILSRGGGDDEEDKDWDY